MDRHRHDPGRLADLSPRWQKDRPAVPAVGEVQSLEVKKLDNSLAAELKN